MLDDIRDEADEFMKDLREDIHDTGDISEFVGEALCDTDGVVNPYMTSQDIQGQGITSPTSDISESEQGITPLTSELPESEQGIAKPISNPDKEIDLFGDLKPSERAWWNKYKIIMLGLIVTGAVVVLGFIIFFLIYFFGGKAVDDLGTRIKDEVSPVVSTTASQSTTSSEYKPTGIMGDELPEPELPDDIQVNEEKYELLRVDFDELQKRYPNAVGWLAIPGTDIEYPVTQYKDNEYYLNHSIDDTYTRSGWVFADYKMGNSVLMRNYIIYGHNMADGTSFGKLKHFINDTEWQSNPDNQYIYYATEYYTAVYQIFNVMRVKSTEVYYHNRELNNDTMIDYLNEMSAYNLLGDVLTYKTPYRADDKIITLSTCNDAQGYEKFVVQGILVHSERTKDADDVIAIN